MNNLPTPTIASTGDVNLASATTATLIDPVRVTAATVADLPQFTEGTYVERSDRTRAIQDARVEGVSVFEVLDAANEFDELRRLGYEAHDLVESLRPVVEQIADYWRLIRAEEARLVAGRSAHVVDGMMDAGMCETFDSFVIAAEDLGETLAGEGIEQ